jgi:N-Acetylglucosaminyltransferase-IV (GnT-IV) conserved region
LTRRVDSRSIYFQIGVRAVAIAVLAVVVSLGIFQKFVPSEKRCEANNVETRQVIDRNVSGSAILANENRLLSYQGIASDDEESITNLRLQVHAEKDEGLSGRQRKEELLICMPTVTRRDGVEYVSNAVKSWWVASRGSSSSSSLQRLIVFGMDADPATAAAHQRLWQGRVFSDAEAAGRRHWSSSWLIAASRRSSSLQTTPRRRTHGDSEARVRWRSKEVLDYAEVLERCAELAGGRYVAVVQDDVLFAPAMAHVARVLDDNDTSALRTRTRRQQRRPGGASVETGDDGRAARRRRHQPPWCAASLFDLGGGGGGGEGGKVRFKRLEVSNMVARVYATEDDDGQEVSRFVGYLRAHFDASPVDWLADSYCAGRRRVTYALHPNPVRHRGAVSSFAENRRDGMVT